MNITWSAERYAQNFQFVPGYGESVMDLLDCPPESRVIDLGCGTGRLTQKLAERGYCALGIDPSPSMLEKAKTSFPSLSFLQADALSYSDHGKADAVFSNAVFHWIDEGKHDILLANIADSLKPGGQLVFEFGGKGNAEIVHKALETAFQRRGLAYPRTFYFPSIGEYAPRMEKAGLIPVFSALFHRKTKVSSLEDWIRMFIQTPFTGMSSAEERAILTEASEEARPLLYENGIWYVDYVRIRMKAIRSSQTKYEVPFLP